MGESNGPPKYIVLVGDGMADFPIPVILTAIFVFTMVLAAMTVKFNPPKNGKDRSRLQVRLDGTDLIGLLESV